MAQRGERRYVVAYDRDCGVCRDFKRLVSLLDVHRRFIFLPIAEAEAGGRLNRVPEKARWSSFHLLLPDGRVESGAAALPRLISQLPSGWILTRAPMGTSVASRLYSTLSRLHGTGSCKGGH